MIYTGARSALAVSKDGTNWLKIPYSSEGIKLGVNYVDSEAMIGKRGVAAYGQTSIGVDGDISFEAFPHSLTWGLYAVLGKASASTITETINKVATSITAYTITPIDVSESLPIYTIAVNHTGESTYTYEFKGVKVGQLTLNLSNNAVPKVSLTVAGIDRTAGTVISPSLHTDDDKPFFVKDIALVADDGSAVTLPDLTSLDLTINNNFDTDTVVLDGTGKRMDIIEQKLDISGTINALYTDKSDGSYAKFKDLYKDGGEIKIKAIIERTDGDKVEISIPKVYIKEFSDNVGGPGKIPLNISFNAINTTATMIEVVSHLKAHSKLID